MNKASAARLKAKPKTTGTGELRARLREATASAILDAAEDVFAEAGVHAASMNAIAAKAGVSVGTLYNHFHDRTALVQALFHERREGFYSHVDDAMRKAHGAPFRAQLDGFVRAILDWFGEHRRFLRIALETETHPLPDTRRQSSMQEIQDRAAKILAVGRAEKALHPADAALYPAILAGIVKGLLVGLLDKQTARRYPRFGDAAQAAIDVFLRGAELRT